MHSGGLESWLKARDVPDPQLLAELIESTVCDGIAPLDGTVLAHAWRAGSLAQLLALDQRLSARKLTPPARAASQACGRQLAALAPTLAPADVLVAALADAVEHRSTAGNYAVVAGTLSRACGLGVEEAVLVELRSAAAGLLSAAVRLGAATPKGAQRLLTQLHPSIEHAAEDARRRTLDELHASIPELETHALSHRRPGVRLFAT